MNSLLPCNNVVDREEFLPSTLTINTVGCREAVSGYVNNTALHVLRALGIAPSLFQYVNQDHNVNVFDECTEQKLICKNVHVDEQIGWFIISGYSF